MKLFLGNIKMTKGKEYRHIVRVVNTDLDGAKALIRALRKIRGISYMMANTVCGLSGIDPFMKAGNLTETHVNKLNEVIKDPLKHGAPIWMINRRKDYETGEDSHLVETDLKFIQENDIKRLKKTKSNRGLRHQWKLPVRGQRTKSNFRRNKGKGMGVKRKK
jgi:small subunit ribosomal protein S13